MSRLLRGLLIGSSLLAAVAVFAPAPARAADIGGLSLRPATFDPNDPATRAYFKPVVAPGSTFTGAVVVGNTTAQSMPVYVYPVDGLTAQTSGAVYANRSDPVTKAGRWVSLTQTTMTLAPDSSTQLTFSVKAPSDAQPGDHLAGIAVEQAGTASSHPSGSAFTVNEVVRGVVGVLIRVPGAATFTMSDGPPKLVQLSGTSTAAVQIPLSNTGTSLGKPALAVSVSGPNQYQRTVHRQLDTILPGDSISYPFIWPDDLPAGSYHVSVQLTGADRGVPRVAADSVLGNALKGSAAPGAAKTVTVVSSGGGLSKGTAVALAAGFVLLLGTGFGTTMAVQRRRRPASS